MLLFDLLVHTCSMSWTVFRCGAGSDLISVSEIFAVLGSDPKWPIFDSDSVTFLHCLLSKEFNTRLKSIEASGIPREE